MIGSIFHNLMDKINILSGSDSYAKTFKFLAEASVDPNSCVVCSSAAEAKKLRSIISENEWNITVMTFAQFINKEFKSTDIKSFYFDDIDKCLKGIVHPKKIKTIKVNTDKVTLFNDAE